MKLILASRRITIQIRIKLDPTETVFLFQPTSMMLRSHSRAGRSESSQSVENVYERFGGAPRPEPEIARPEVIDVPRVGRDPGVGSDSPIIDSSVEIVETPVRTIFSRPRETGNSI